MPGSGIDTAESASLLRYSQPLRNWVINLSLLGLTFLSTTAFGVSVVQSFRAGRPMDVDSLFTGYSLLYHLNPAFWRGLYFSVPLLLILMAHEMGHYITALRAGVNASLPYFLPSPLLLGTFGAFIRIRTPIYSRKKLFDIGVSGPLAGFAVLLPVLLVGTALSKTTSIPDVETAFSFGRPLALAAAEWITLGKIPTHLILHPFAVAAWAGLLATALNLLPMGQLDGGHILYAVFGERWHRILSTLFVVVMAGLGFVYYGWWFWAAVMFVLGRRHPLVFDRSPLGPGRLVLSALAFVILLLSAVVVPVAVR